MSILATRRFSFLLLTCALAGTSERCVAESNPVDGPFLAAADRAAVTPEPGPGAEIAGEREEIAERLRVAQRALPEEKKRGAPAPTSREIELLKQKDLTLSQHQAMIERSEELARERTAIEATLGELREQGLHEERPFSFLLLETLNDRLANETDRLEAGGLATEAARVALDRAKNAALEQDKARRSAREQRLTNTDRKLAGKLALAEKVGELESELANGVALLRQAELDNQRHREETLRLSVALFHEKVALVEQDVTFTASDLDEQLIQIDRKERTLTSELESNQLARKYLDQQWSDARQQLDENPSEREDPNASNGLKAQVVARELARRLRGEQAERLNDQLQWLAPMRSAWKRRFRIATDDFASKELYEWKDEAEGILDDVDHERRLVDARLDGLRSKLADVDRQIKGSNDDRSSQRRWLRDQQRTLRTSVQFYNETYIRMEAAERLHEKLIAEVDRRTQQFSLQQWAAVGWQRVVDVWSYEFTSSDDNPITVGKVVMGLLLLVLGVAISKRLSYFLRQTFLPRFGVEAGAAHALGRLTFYVLASCAALLALRLVNVPLTLFTFLGGAIAIGVGFGAQRPINNFLSGLVLLIERPIRIGDMIQIAQPNGAQINGIVEAIGSRSTRIRTETNLETIIPNSALVENNVANWTLSDPTIRSHVSVGVVYGTPTEPVIQILQEVAEQHIRVLDAPEAFVWFTNFGDNSLDFELHFFLVFRTVTEQKRIQSELRLEIERRFRDAGIVVAFPQRDVHLDTVKPLEVHIARPSLQQRRQSA